MAREVVGVTLEGAPVFKAGEGEIGPGVVGVGEDGRLVLAVEEASDVHNVAMMHLVGAAAGKITSVGVDSKGREVLPAQVIGQDEHGRPVYSVGEGGARDAMVVDSPSAVARDAHGVLGVTVDGRAVYAVSPDTPPPEVAASQGL